MLVYFLEFLTETKTTKKLGAQADIEAAFGSKLEWKEAGKACRIIGRTAGDIKKGQSEWPSFFEWLMDSARKIKAIAEKFDN